MAAPFANNPELTGQTDASCTGLVVSPRLFSLCTHRLSLRGCAEHGRQKPVPLTSCVAGVKETSERQRTMDRFIVSGGGFGAGSASQ